AAGSATGAMHSDAATIVDAWQRKGVLGPAERAGPRWIRLGGTGGCMSAETTMTRASTGAEEVAWDLTQIYESGEDPRLHSEVADALARGLRFSGRYHGRIAELDASELAEAVAELEDMEATLFR